MILIVFGAGASHGSGCVIPEVPPLGREVFDRLNAFDPQFFDLFENGAALRKSRKVAEAFRDDFEGAMKKYGPAGQINDWGFIRLLGHYFSRFVNPSDGCLYRAAFELLRRVPGGHVIATVNYDLLIDRALDGLSLDYTREVPWATGEPFSFLKLHGSSDLAIDWGSVRLVGIGPGAKATFSKTTIDRPVCRIYPHELAQYYSDPQSPVDPPVIVPYQWDKPRWICPRYIGRMLGSFKRACDSANKIVVVGMRYVDHDKHIWRPLLSAAAPLFIVDPAPSSALKAIFRGAKRRVEFLEKSFREFVDSEATRIVLPTT